MADRIARMATRADCNIRCCVRNVGRCLLLWSDWKPIGKTSNRDTIEGGDRGLVVERYSLSHYKVDLTVPEDGRVVRGMFHALESCFGAHRVARLAKRADEHRLPGEDYFNAFLRHNRTGIRVRGHDLAKIPRTGPMVAIANHPTGLCDAIMLASVADRHIRSDSKLLSVRRFAFMPGWKDRCIPIDHPSPSGKPKAVEAAGFDESSEAVRQFLRAGGAVLIFPCGIGFRKNTDGHLEEGDWRHGAFAFAAKTGATVLPIHIGASGSPHRLRLHGIHPILYQAAYPFEIFHLRGKTVDITIGDPNMPELKEALKDLSTAPERVREIVFRLPEIYR